MTALVLTFGLSAGSVRAAPGAPATVDELVDEVESTYQGVSSVRADFVQTVRNPMTGVQEKQRGRISMERPRKLRVELGLPVKSAVVSDGDRMWVYSSDQKQVIVQKEVGDASGMGILLEDLSRLGELFDAQLVHQQPPRPSYTVLLTPKKASGIKSLQLTFSKQRYLLQELVVTDAMDNVTEMDFSMVRLNVDVPDAEFVFQAPPGTQVIAPAGM